MTRLVLAIGLSTFLMAAPLGALADEAPAPAPQGKPAAPATEGCMPGGGCCGAGAACPKAVTADEGTAAGGCPCQKAKQAAEQAAPAAKP
jgi:hypothetical protein